ncbi:MAG: PQQ-binding-like beta-propeller repeat protein [Planctomycetes bacterium]|nr:PQQ-binding-like beta-propeller repeat protein [Planctomycetota bacterium]
MKSPRLSISAGFSCLIALAWCASLPAAEIDPMDWPSWRGPEQNGISREKGLIDSWSPGGENLLWSKPDIMTYSTPIVMRGKLYVLSRSEPDTPREGERVVCLDPATGNVIWENKFNVFLSDVPAERVGWSSCVGDPETGNVYALGVGGYFQCLNGETGKPIWTHSMSEEFGLLTTYGGRTNLPVLFEDLVIISGVFINWGDLDKPVETSLAFDARVGGRKDMAKPAHRFMALDKKTGEVVWFSGTRLLPEDTTYSTPILTVFNGQAALVCGGGDGAVYAFQPRTGKIIWRYQLSRRGINTSPIAVDGVVYIGQSEENIDDNTMGTMVAIDGTKTGEITQTGAIWKVKEAMIGKSSPIYVDGRVYAADDSSNFFVFDAKTGKQIGRKQKLLGAIMRSSLLYADGKIYATTLSGWHVLQPTEDGVKLVNRMRLPNLHECYGSPIVSHGRIFLATSSGMFCLGKPGTQPSADPLPKQPQEGPVASDSKAALVQVVPAEALIKSGQKLKLTVRTFNARGQLLKEGDPAEFTVDGAGKIDSTGAYQADDAGNRHAYITAKLGQMAGLSRLRIVPDLPWKFDFNDNQVPITWIGARYRYQPRTVDGEPMIAKITTIPKGTRSQSWMGHIDLHDYTIQADVRAGDGGELPDMGLIAQRYTLDLMGANQQLQIRSWTPQLARFSKSVPMAWKRNVWYTLKFSAGVEGGKAVLRGKVWERGQPEPQAWTIEATDAEPNVVGSPGLFGNATNAEVFVDNISVTPNG